MLRFRDRTVVVTGASLGLGRALALAFAREGAWVGVGFLSHETEALATLAACRAAGGDGAIIGCDVRERAAITEALQAIDRQRPIDVLVNNAGVQRDAFALGSGADWDEVIDVNLTGAYNCTHAVARAMLGRKRGAIVNVASLSALRVGPGRSAYAASKAGLLGFTRAVARELAPGGVRVNALVPGYVEAGMAARMDWGKKKALGEAIALGRFADPDEVARAALFLASDDASYVIGHALVVDGGASL